MKHTTILTALLLAGGLLAPGALAQEQDQNQVRVQTEAQKQERIYGSELMTSQERANYQAKMRSLKTEQERAAFRAEHHAEMQKRAEAMGKTLPDQVPDSPGHQGKSSQSGGQGKYGQGSGMGGGTGSGGMGGGKGGGQGGGKGGK